MIMMLLMVMMVMVMIMMLTSVMMVSSLGLSESIHSPSCMYKKAINLVFVDWNTLWVKFWILHNLHKR